MHTITLYNENTGQLTLIMSSTVEGFENDITDPFVSGRYEGDSYYVSGGVPTERPDNPTLIDKTTALTTELVTLSNIPNPSTITVVGLGSFEVLDGVFEIDFDYAGTFKITVDSFPSKAKGFTITCE